MAETPETPTPSLAERLEQIAAYLEHHEDDADDLRAAAAQLRQLRQLDRIKALVLDDEWALRDLLVVALNDAWGDYTPTCDDTGLVAPLGGRGSDGPDPCPHCTPAAGSSSPDTAALVAELRGPSGLASTSRAKHLTVGVCAVAADALEAQAARITELEAAMADHTLTTPTEETE